MKVRWTRHHKISLFSAVSTGIASLGTLAAFYIAYQALNYSKEAVAEGKNLNSSAIAFQKRAIDAADKDSRKRFSLDSMTLTTQINELNQRQKEFAIENAPILAMTNVHFIEQIRSKSRLSIYLNLNNLGKQAVTVKNILIDIILSNRVVSGYDNNVEKLPVNNIDVPVEGNIPFSWQSAKPLDGLEYSKINDGKLSIYLAGEVNYINRVTNEKRKFSFIYKISTKEKMDYIKNDDIHIN
jgi:hypothetical protein